MIRRIRVSKIADLVAELYITANNRLSPDMRRLLRQAHTLENHQPAAELMGILNKNADIAESEGMPLCQDTGMAVVFCQIGCDVRLTGGQLNEAVNEGIRLGCEKGMLRKSVVADPLRRSNTGDNTPAVLHVRLVSGRYVALTVVPKGFGSENMSRMTMLKPSDGEEGVIAFAVETIQIAGANACPPVVLGVGVGGNFELAPLLAKEALTLPMDESNPDPYYAVLESEILKRVNQTGIGAQGFGGAVTAMGVRILSYPTHIAGLPVAVNVGCHASRHAFGIL